MDTYQANTYLSRDPLRRFSHKTRFQVALNMLVARRPASLLDYGAGDGHFISLVTSNTRLRGIKSVGFEPRQSSGAITNSLDGLAPGFDCITCLEVLEHLTDEQQEQFYSDVRRLLRRDGFVVASVPVMIGPAGFLKVMLEKYRSHREAYTAMNAVRCLLAIPPKQRWVNASGVYHHLGFDHRTLRERLRSVFDKVDETCSPFPSLPLGLNSQVFFVCSGLRLGDASGKEKLAG